MKIHIDHDLTKQELDVLIAKGAKFVSYQYIISVPIFFPIRRFSKLYFIKPNEQSSKYSLPYNLMSFVFGLWGLPMGPPFMVKTFILNFKGGMDLTEDVLVNLKEDSLLKEEIILERPSRYFLTPTKSNQKEFERVFKEIKKYNIISEPIILGYFINTSSDEKPYYVIGISSILTEDFIQIIRKELYRRFFKHIKFVIVSLLDSNYEHIERLKTEGLKLN
jgi:hypothetical protein